MPTKQDHKRWRKQFNYECLTRDNFKCVFCNVTENLDVHHITDRHELPNGGYVLSNGITLYPEHHLKCEQYHIKGECEEIFTPNALYIKINSTFDAAFNDSLNLI